MDTALILLVILTMILLPIFLIIWIIQAIRKRPTKKLKFAFLLTLVVFVISTILAISATCNHEWSDATCTAPKTCALCGEIEGETLKHQWEDATCTAPKTCSLCGLTQGAQLEHQWVDATCSAPKTCSICEETQGDALGHTAGDWVLDEDSRDIISTTIWRRRYCENCKEVVDSELRSFALHEDNKFIFTPVEFAERLEKIFKYIDNAAYKTEIVALSDSMGCVVLDEETVAIIMFMSADGVLTGPDTLNRDIGTIVVKYYSDDISEVIKVMIGVLITCDSSLETSDAADIAKRMILATMQGDAYYHNGIGYVFGDNGDGYQLIVSVMDN